MRVTLKKPAYSVIFLLFVLLVPNSGTSAPGSGIKYPVGMTITPFGGNYITKDNTLYKEKSSSYGVVLDIVSSFAFSPSYSKNTKYGTFSFQLPLTLDYGLELGYIKIPHLFTEGSGKVTTAQLHLVLLRTLSIGAGGYQVDYTGQPTGMKTSGYGGFVGTQLSLLPYSNIHPIADIRWYGKPLNGTTIMFGFKIGSNP